MTIPQNFGKSKISMLRGEETDKARSKKKLPPDLSFSIEAESSAAPLQPPSFNVLYVQTPRIGLLQTPLVQALVETWQDTVDLIRPLMRFGFPETSLKTKCPYYNDNLYATASGQLLASNHLRKLMIGVDHGNLHSHSHHGQQAQHSSSSSSSSSSILVSLQETEKQQRELDAAIGTGNLAFLAQTGLDQQPQFRHTQLIRKSQLLVPDIPSGSLVLALNLLAYWMITHQARKGFGA